MAARLRTRLAALVAGALLSGTFAPGCGTQCERNPHEAPVRYDAGVTDRARGTYFSAPYDGPYLDFPPGRTYRFVHGLGGKPESVRAWLSFAEYPSQGATPEGFVEAAGNQVTWQAATAEYVDVRNDTCSDVRLRIEASDPSAPDASTGDAGTGDVGTGKSDAGDAGP